MFMSEELLNDDKALKYLANTRGINKKTAEHTGIGIDRKKHPGCSPYMMIILL